MVAPSKIVNYTMMLSIPIENQIFQEKIRYSKRKSDIPRESQIFQEKIRYSKRKSDIPRESQIFQEEIRYSKRKSYIPRENQIFQEKIRYSKRKSDIPRENQIFQEKIRYSKRKSDMRPCAASLICLVKILKILENSEDFILKSLQLITGNSKFVPLSIFKVLFLFLIARNIFRHSRPPGMHIAIDS